MYVVRLPVYALRYFILSVIYAMYNGPGEKEEDRRDTLEMDLEEIKRLAKEATPPPTFSTDGSVVIHDEEDDYG